MTTLDYLIIGVKVLIFGLMCTAASPLRPMRFGIVVVCVVLIAGCTPMQRKVMLGVGTIVAIGTIKTQDSERSMMNIPGKPDCATRPETCR